MTIVRFPAAGLLTLLLAAAWFAPIPAAAGDLIHTTFLGGTAIDGYDPVAYFREGRPVEGDPAFTHEWQGATWRFASAANRDAFAAAPESFAPAYGGYCAYGVSQGYTVGTDPEAWSIVDGRLYLNYSKSVQRTWEEDFSGYIRQADSQWPDLRAELED